MAEYRQAVDSYDDYMDFKAYAQAEGPINVIEAEQKDSITTRDRSQTILPLIVAKLGSLDGPPIERVFMKVESHRDHHISLHEWSMLKGAVIKHAQKDVPFLMIQKVDNSLEDRLRVCFLVWTSNAEPS